VVRGVQVGDWVNVEDSEKTRRVTGRCDYKAVTNTNYLARDYSMTWRAPMELTYQPLFVRVTWVLDNQFFCPGKFSQVRVGMRHWAAPMCRRSALGRVELLASKALHAVRHTALSIAGQSVSDARHSAVTGLLCTSRSLLLAGCRWS
jgi:hypothetical protein